MIICLFHDWNYLHAKPAEQDSQPEVVTKNGVIKRVRIKNMSRTRVDNKCCLLVHLIDSEIFNNCNIFWNNSRLRHSKKHLRSAPVMFTTNPFAELSAMIETTKTTAVRFSDVPAGSYAISVIDDQNNGG